MAAPRPRLRPPEEPGGDGGYPPAAMRALAVIWWATGAYIFAVWAVG